MQLMIFLNILIFVAILIVTTVVSFIGIPIAILFLVIAVVHYWQYGPTVFDSTMLLYLTVATFLAVFLDNIVLILGLKTTDASRRGYIGAFVGSIAGIFTGSIIGFLGFTFIGATIGELLHGKEQKHAMKSGIGATLGLIFGSLLRAVITITIAAYVSYQLLF